MPCRPRGGQTLEVGRLVLVRGDLISRGFEGVHLGIGSDSSVGGSISGSSSSIRIVVIEIDRRETNTRRAATLALSLRHVVLGILPPGTSQGRHQIAPIGRHGPLHLTPPCSIGIAISTVVQLHLN